MGEGALPSRLALRAVRLISVLALLSMSLLAITPGVARAHAELVRSDPAVDAIVEAMPARVYFWFSEEPEQRFTEVQVLDPSARRVDRGDLRMEGTDRLNLSIGVRDAGVGTYTVLWKALSAVDGHVTRGAFGFTVGLDQVPTALAVTGESQASTATPDKVLVRLLTYLGLAALVAPFLFVPSILLPALALGAATFNTTALILRRIWTIALVGAGLALLATIGALATQSAAAFDAANPAALPGAIGAMAFGTRFGALWWMRLVLILGLSALALVCRVQGPSPVLMRVGLGLGGAVLLVLALGSHAAAVPGIPGVAIALDWLHFAAVVLWIGGLLHLAVTVWALIYSPRPAEGTKVAAHLVPRFSVLGVLAVGSLLLTGFYQAWLNVGGLAALIGTDYGRALLAKLALVLPLLALGAVNLLILSPRLRRAATRSAGRADLVRHLRHTVLGEIAFGVGVLLVAGVLANLQPGREAILTQGVARSAADEDVRATIRLQPGLAGLNRFDVQLTDRRSGVPITDAEKIALRFTNTVVDLGESELVAYHRGDGHYVASGGQLVSPGPWRIEAVVRRPGRLDVRPAVEFPIGTPSYAGPSAAAPSLAEGALVLGIELLVVGLIAFGYVYWVAPRDRRLVPVPLFIAVASLAIGSLAAGGGVGTLRAGAQTINPIPPTRESVERGRTTYQAECALCHGETGRGDGPAAPGLRPAPADFRVHLAAGHTDGQLFDWITNGYPGTAMPAYRDKLSEEDRWNVLNYIRLTFGPGR